MKIKSAVSICLKRETLCLYDETVGETGEVRQWIGDGAGLYLSLATMTRKNAKEREAEE